MWQQGKQISQIISYIWRYYDDNIDPNGLPSSPYILTIAIRIET